MIRLHRPSAPPQTLMRRAAAETQALWATFQAGSDPQVKRGIYNAPDVKQVLVAVQYMKCAYCETKDTRSPGAVEHFRPKHGWKQHKGDTLTRPGYFWLGYEWSNLLYSCTMCNDAGHKGNVFPLANPAARATTTSPSIASESALLINPYEEDPEAHLDWKAHVPKAKRSSVRGQTTIDTFGLIKDQVLMDARRDYLRTTSLIVDLVESFPASDTFRLKLRIDLLRRLDDDAPYAAMIRAALGARIRSL